MATVQMTQAQASGFVPQFWANRALDVLRANIVLAKLVQRDTAFGPGDFATQGSTLTIPYPGKFVAVDKAQGTPVTPQVPVGGSSVALTLSKHKVVPFSVEDFANAQANMDLMDRYMKPAVIAIAEQFESDLFALAAGLTTTIGSAGTALVAATLRTVKQTFLNQKVSVSDRSLIVCGSDEASLLGDASLQTYFAYSQTQALKEGAIGKLYGMDIFPSQLVAVSGDSYTMTAGGAPTAGSWLFNWNGFSVQIAWNATGAQMQAAIQAAIDPSFGQAITVTGGAGGPFTVTMASPAADINVAPTANVAALTGGTAFTINKTAGAANQNLAIHKDTFLFATRPFRDPGADSGVRIATAMDPQTGLTIRVAGQYDINAMAYRCNVDMLYGMVVLRPGVGMIVQS